jgi:very-short-patch-repair endonuclease
MNASDQILSQLALKDGQLASSLARSIGLDRTEVNRILYGALKGRVRQDKGYKWWLVSASTAAAGGKPSTRAPAVQPVLDNDLSRLCRYYLSCLSRDDRQKAETWARSFYNDKDYAELAHLPQMTEFEEWSGHSQEASRLIGKVRASKGKKELLLGYPTCLHRFKTKKGDWTWTVRPVLLLPVQVDDDGALTIDTMVPELNPLVIQDFLEVTDGDSVLQAQVELREALGLTEDLEEPPPLDEVAARLVELRPEWGWKEEIDPTTISDGAALDTLDEPGIYNRGILLVSDRSPYTRGLDAELQKLMRIPESEWGPTALGQWVTKKLAVSSPSVKDPLLEVLALNSEQRAAVEHSRHASLTVVTGPPGTGKSQVVSNLLINAAWQGQRTLFTSKNNKAVDVVEARVNAFSDRPLLMRLGQSQYAGKLAVHIKGLLSSVVTSEDQRELDRARGEYDKIRSEWERVEFGIEHLRRCRNRMPVVDAGVAPLRDKLGESRFRDWLSCEEETPIDRWKVYQRLGERCRKQSAGFVQALFWKWIEPSRRNKLFQAVEADAILWKRLGIETPSREESAEAWLGWIQELSWYAGQMQNLSEYRAARDGLNSARSLEELTAERNTLVQKLTTTSQELWDLWMRLAPQRLDADAKTVLGQYSVLLELVAASSGDGGAIDAKTWSRFFSLSEKVTKFLPCWAVTSLSVKGRIPLAAGYFDLVVIDEASQCDIASMIPLLFRAKRAVVIGDPHQLRHITRISAKDEIQLMRQAQVMDDYLEWSYAKHSLYDLAAIRAGGKDVIGLVDHHRSHADIIEFSNKHIYGGALRVATKYDRLILPRRGQPAVRWVDVRGQVERPNSGSSRNPPEARAVVQELRRIVLEQEYQGSIGVVTPFRAQENLIRELVQQDRELSACLGALSEPFIVDTADGFQGDQRSLILFSPVLARDMAPGTVRFLEGDRNRFNVAITRAESGLVVVGDKVAAIEGKWSILADFAAYQEGLQRRSGVLAREQGLPTSGAEYPPVANPESVSDWERLLYTALYNAGIPTIPQYSVESYRLDLAVVQGEHRLDIEVDGERYHKDWTGELCRRDLIRNHRLIELGWDVKRLWVHQVRDDLDGCVEAIKKWVDQFPKEEQPSVPEAVKEPSLYIGEDGCYDHLDSASGGEFCWICEKDGFTISDVEECVICGSITCYECGRDVKWVHVRRKETTYGVGRLCESCQQDEECKPCAKCGKYSRSGLSFPNEDGEELCDDCSFAEESPDDRITEA